MAKKETTLKVKRIFFGVDSGGRGTEILATAEQINQLSTGTIVAALTGNVTGNVEGNVTGNVTGDVTGDVDAQVVTVGHPTQGGSMDITVAVAEADITADASVTIPVAVPAGAKILGASLNVETALTAGETWDAAYATGSSQAIASEVAVAKNTKVNAIFDVNTDTDIASDETNIAITKNGGGAFTAAGKIKAAVYYVVLNDLPDAA